MYLKKKTTHLQTYTWYIDQICEIPINNELIPFLGWEEARRCPVWMPRTVNLSNSAQQRNIALQLKDRGRYKRSSAFMPTGHNLFSVLRSWAEGLASPTEKRRMAWTLQLLSAFYFPPNYNSRSQAAVLDLTWKRLFISPHSTHFAAFV